MKTTTSTLAVLLVLGGAATGCGDQTESTTPEARTTAGDTDVYVSETEPEPVAPAPEGTMEESAPPTPHEGSGEMAPPQTGEQPQTGQGDRPLSSYEGQEPIGATRGTATWYGEDFAGQQTASGETFDPNQMTAATRRYPLGSVIRVVNPENEQAVIVRINDRLREGNQDGADVDLSRAAAERIGMIEEGRTAVVIEVLELDR